MWFWPWRRRPEAETLEALRDELWQTHYALFNQLKDMETRLMTALDDIRTSVEQSNSVTASAVTLIQSLAERIRAGLEASKDDDGEELEALAKELDEKSHALAAAISANTLGGGGEATSGNGGDPGATADGVGTQPQPSGSGNSTS